MRQPPELQEVLGIEVAQNKHVLGGRLVTDRNFSRLAGTVADSKQSDFVGFGRVTLNPEEVGFAMRPDKDRWPCQRVERI